MPKTAVVICAAGASARMGGVKKEYQKLSNSSDALTVLGSAVSAFASVPSVEIIVIAISGNEAAAREALPPQILSEAKPKVAFVEGGQSRRASVYNALSFLAGYSPEYVLIHDGARPKITAALIEKVIKETENYGAAIPLLPVTDTPKECNAPLENTSAVFIKTHLKRANTGAAQTPQGFKFPEILHAHEKAAGESEEFTDDAEIWGRFCGKVAAVMGEPENLKITFPDDLGGISRE